MINKRRQAGLLSVDAAMGLIVLAVMVTLATGWIIKMSDQQSYRIAADKQRAVAEAFSKYLKDNFAVVLASATATAPVQVTVAMLQNTNYLPAGFTATNEFGQTLIGLARKPNANQLEAIVVTTGGQTIPEVGIRTIAENLGGPGGFISTLNPSVIQGIRGGWQVALSNYAISPGAGHTASALFLMDGELANDYLYRNAVPGHPEFNTMNTDLTMGGHNINSAAAITATGNITTGADVSARNVTATGTVTAATANVTGETYTGGWFRTRGDTGWYSEKWGGGIYQSDADWVRIYNNKGLATGGTLVGGQIVSFGNMTATGRISTNEFISVGGIASEGAACGDYRLIATTSSGNKLACNNGRWQSFSSTKGQYVIRKYWPSGQPTTPDIALWCQANPITGSCSCPAGSQDYGYMTGQSWLNTQWDTFFETHFCI
ncbi:shufflon system plasmid conjugative transfer pilus tip adhesin PilV [Pseudomonas sp. RW407]|uniref:shufflon system plasmid conjugative transfer pilus tip adhesin PilV n=1 Tax=Pseudomonas sp. RW407 TaxID=2202894 RepID=UPI000D6F9742|nr:shufflon system plasmid conjugative transfer pilus tip adhesin PilV [Pseudomonas sp. RW407]PWU32067.1 shufflon system plasmid conjugative transfer pilus tip adhesin PilV [Pseudomonas sp. RW407]